MDKIVLGILFVGLVLISGCSSDDVIFINKDYLTTINGTVYDSSKSFALQDFADSCSIVSNSNISNLTCVTGDPAFLRYNSSSDVWTLSCCGFKTSKCYWYNVTNITGFVESPLFADNILNVEIDSEGVGSMCCNSQMSQCFFKKFNISCDKEYDQIFTSVSFDDVTGNWSITSCLDGFK